LTENTSAAGKLPEACTQEIGADGADDDLLTPHDGTAGRRRVLTQHSACSSFAGGVSEHLDHLPLPMEQYADIARFADLTGGQLACAHLT
jgi:hypothetical protein